MPTQFIYRWGIWPLWLILTSSVWFRPLTPIDETRYLSVAWEMWLRGDFWVPYLNGMPYSHKPPLLFWLIQLGWQLGGVNEWWPRLVGPLCAGLNLILIRKLAMQLWPERTDIALLAPWLLLSTLLWSLFASSVMFDILLTCQVLLGMLGLLALSRNTNRQGIIYLTVAIGLGLLAKGPVIFLHILPTALLVKFWVKDLNKTPWMMNVALSVLLGIALALAWAIPAGMQGGTEYANAIFWRQTADRTLGTEIHVRPLLWYLYFLPLVLFPWIFWPRVWRNLTHVNLNTDFGMRFCLVWGISGLLIFSLIPSKQIHYLIPILPPLVLALAAMVLKNHQTDSLLAELTVPLLLMLVAGFLMFLPELPALSRYHWAQAIEMGWGLTVLIIATLLIFITGYVRYLSAPLVSTAMVLSVLAGFIFFFKYNSASYDLRPAANQLQALRTQGIPCAFVGNYQGQLNFLAKLTQPLPILARDQVPDWAAQHQNGYLLSIEKTQPTTASFWQAHREYWLVFRLASQSADMQAL